MKNFDYRIIVKETAFDSTNMAIYAYQREITLEELKWLLSGVEKRPIKRVLSEKDPQK